MKKECFICKKKIESNDVIMTLELNLNQINGEELGDFIQSPLQQEVICGLCGNHIGLITMRGIESLNTQTKQETSK